jgi:hypothetical protein
LSPRRPIFKPGKRRDQFPAYFQITLFGGAPVSGIVYGSSLS